MSSEPAAGSFPAGFFDRSDPTSDALFYRDQRLVTHIDDRAIEAVGLLYTKLDLAGDVLDLMSSWVSHFTSTPTSLTALGMNASELAANPMATATVVQDLNTDPILPFDDASFDAVTCCVSVDYLTRPIQVFADVARVLRPGGTFVCTFSNRCFPTKAVRGWLMTDDAGRCDLVRRYFELARTFAAPTVDVAIAAGLGSDPLYAVWATAEHKAE